MNVIEPRHLAAILAGLRLAQQHYESFKAMDHHGEIDSPLTKVEIDRLCVAINSHQISTYHTHTLIDSYRKLWKAVEDGEIDQMFFELRERFRSVMQLQPGFLELFIPGIDQTTALVSKLIQHSAFFSVTPFPNDLYLLTFKDEHRDFVFQSVERYPEYTVILGYPESSCDNDDLEIYSDTTHAKTASEAVDIVRKMASNANQGNISPDDFRVITVLAGNVRLDFPGAIST